MQQNLVDVYMHGTHSQTGASKALRSGGPQRLNRINMYPFLWRSVKIQGAMGPSPYAHPYFLFQVIASYICSYLPTCFQTLYTPIIMVMYQLYMGMIKISKQGSYKCNNLIPQQYPLYNYNQLFREVLPALPSCQHIWSQDKDMHPQCSGHKSTRNIKMLSITYNQIIALVYTEWLIYSIVGQ